MNRLGLSLMVLSESMRSHPDGYGNGYFFAICYAPLSDLYYVADDKRAYPARRRRGVCG